MAFVVEQRRRRDLTAAQELRAVTHWADLHRVEGDEVGALDPEVAAMLFPPGAHDSLLGREGELRLAGQGAFVVTEFAICQLAAALAMSEPAARAYVGQGLEVRDRLPRLWDRVMGGQLPAWKALKIAEETIPLTSAAADYVDRHLAAFAHQLSFGRIMRTVEAAIARHDPDTAADRARKAAERRGVWIDDAADGTSAIHGIVNTPDAVAFDTALTQVAGALEALGDLDPDQVRRAKAVGILADPQTALDLTTGSASTGTGTGTGTDPHMPQTRKRRPGPTLHVHLHTDAITGMRAGDGTGHLARVDGFGARTLDTVQQWLADLAPGAQITVTPVVDLTEHIAVDAHEAPDRLRTQITERDHFCRFPWCGRRGVFDLDHIDPYVDPDDGGPPGQTSTANLARLCRFHHRVKTHSDWTYQRDPCGSLTWTSPLGRIYTVDEHGTYPRN